MTQETILANAMLVLPDETVRGALLLRDGKIQALETGTSVPSGAVDCQGDYVAPGLVELHTDNLERHLHPRPKVNWPHLPAILAHDQEMAGAGVTTVFDALRIGFFQSAARNKLRKGYAREVATELRNLGEQGTLKIRHHVHLRAETCSETLIDELADFGPEDRVGIMSLMDHTPGQRQFADMGKFETYTRGKHDLPSDGFDDYVRFLQELRSRLGQTHENAVVEAAARCGAVLASHDDTTEQQVETSVQYGARLAEFPTTVAAARASKMRGMATVLGGPNLVRGASHSGNVAAAELADLGILDIISSDYAPASLLLGAVQLGQRWDNMAKGLATVTSTPAQAVGWTDRGRLGVGLAADVIRFKLVGNVPTLQAVWCKGARVA
ncbi:alpha-D-ribose 1-methylphosphonate 5-triphosphate diphosphatase [Shimia gijangensis]|uniref:Alpha-D-ribose 1-methylphosphonate 5-triphosphate diphosphatase n=1 Tax=Shimia gijangensis TaxID=1470563 RepID=A0A1M6RZ90_9RHOB|nr:alpha-D-ribose 1-methylphosphonate 5-triphosphate diphosphatase [Shimia gijangensis]SHK37786.1 alpha-D-ribose 1-methylphosphonate 5-triphosphate diphosphatase [Shimia gijangensis]